MIAPETSPAPAARHGSTAVAAFVVVVFCLAVTGGISKPPEPVNQIFPQQAAIRLKQEGAASISVTIGNGPGSAIVEIDEETGNKLAIDLPDEWKFREVRGASIADVQTDTVADSLHRWNMKAGTSLSFTSPFPVSRIQIVRASPSPLHVHLIRLDLQTQAQQESDVLVSKTEITLPE